MSHATSPSTGGSAMLDVAVVGAGVSGCYSAWRLAEARPDGRFALFEGSDRIGGRLWSLKLPEVPSIPAELGGMFFNDGQDIVHHLCTERFDLPRTAVTLEPDFNWLRRHRFTNAQFTDPTRVPYFLAPDERGLPYHRLLEKALFAIVPELKSLWPFASNGSQADTVAYLRRHRFRGRPLYAWGYWNLLQQVLSNEAYEMLVGAVSAISLFSNWNGFDAVYSLICDMSGHWFKLDEGYQTLPETLAREFAGAGGTVRLEERLCAIRPIDPAAPAGPLELTFATAEGQTTVRARRVILALPQFALEALDLTALPARAGAAGTDGLSALAAVQAIPASKLFCVFDEPWWRSVPDGPGVIGAGELAVSHTDLPLRQCYYLGTDPGTGKGLLIASYGEAWAVSYWEPWLAERSLAEVAPVPCPTGMVDEIRRQLAEMHGTAVPAPRSAFFVDWARPPFGGGWHLWQPGWRSWEVWAKLRRPTAAAVSICGESYSAYQGWSEGALTSAEYLLETELQLPRPDWLSATGSMTPYLTGNGAP